MGFDAPENAKNHLFHVFGLASRLSDPTEGAFALKIKIIQEPIIMVLEGLKYKMLASDTLVTILLSKIDVSQNCVLLAECAHLVYKMKKYVLNRCPFSLRFF